MPQPSPWSIKGIDPDSRQLAKEAAQRSGMTLGAWLSHQIAQASGAAPLAQPPRQRTASAALARGGVQADDGPALKQVMSAIRDLTDLVVSDSAARAAQVETGGGSRIAELEAEFAALREAHETALDRLDGLARLADDLRGLAAANTEAIELNRRHATIAVRAAAKLSQQVSEAEPEPPRAVDSQVNQTLDALSERLSRRCDEAEARSQEIESALQALSRRLDAAAATPMFAAIETSEPGAEDEDESERQDPPVSGPMFGAGDSTAEDALDGDASDAAPATLRNEPEFSTTSLEAGADDEGRRTLPPLDLTVNVRPLSAPELRDRLRRDLDQGAVSGGSLSSSIRKFTGFIPSYMRADESEPAGAGQDPLETPEVLRDPAPQEAAAAVAVAEASESDAQFERTKAASPSARSWTAGPSVKSEPLETRDYDAEDEAFEQTWSRMSWPEPSPEATAADDDSQASGDGSPGAGDGVGLERQISELVDRALGGRSDGERPPRLPDWLIGGADDADDDGVLELRDVSDDERDADAPSEADEADGGGGGAISGALMPIDPSGPARLGRTIDAPERSDAPWTSAQRPDGRGAGLPARGWSSVATLGGDGEAGGALTLAVISVVVISALTIGASLTS